VLFTGAYAQVLDVRKDIITIDKVPYAKVTGTIGMFKPADLLVTSLNGDSLLTIQAWQYPTGNPMFDHLSGYEIKFMGSRRAIIKSSTQIFAKKEHLLEFILQDAQYVGLKRDREKEFNKDLIQNNGIAPEVEQEFIEKFNNEAQIQWAQQYEAKEREVLKQMFPLNKEPATPLYKISPYATREIKNGTVQRLDIYNNKDILATIDKEVVSYMSVTYTYSFYKRLETPFTVGDKQISKIMIATFKIDGAFAKMFLNLRGRWETVNITNPANAEKELTDLLISNKLL
jgi:hypothetical protein